MKFTEALDEYLELKQMEETEHPDYIDGYTCKNYYKDLNKAADNLNSFFKDVDDITKEPSSE